jgi:flagellar biosynthesis regulator FlaF
VSDKIDQASVIVNTAMKLLEDVQDERNRLSAERDNLIKINIKLTEDIEKIKLNINKFNTSWENDN